jgi:hypothetical protein
MSGSFRAACAAIAISLAAGAEAQAGSATLIIKRGSDGVAAVRYPTRGECERVLAAMLREEEREFQRLLNRPTQPNVYNVPAPKMGGIASLVKSSRPLA